MEEIKYKASNNIEVKYKQKKGKYDYNHTLFVFSGFLNEKPGNYDFANALDNYPGHVIWISDDFNEQYAYYLCQKLDFSIRDAVVEFINFKLNELGLEKEDATVTGFSKGGSSALYFGLYLNFTNIVVTVPQLKIGHYLDSNWKHVARDIMCANYNSSHITYLDKLIVTLLKKEKNFKKNIYLLTSEYDEQYETEVAPYLDDFKKYTNFNLLKTFSSFVREHNQVTSHHTALLISIYYALASEAIPRFNQGEVNFFGSLPKPTTTIKELKPIIDLRYVNFSGERFFIDGIGAIKGCHAQNWEDIEHILIFKNKETDETTEKKLAKVNRPHITRELFSGNNFTIYDKCVFTTYQQKGMRLDHLEIAPYQLFLKININDSSLIEPLKSNKQIDFICDEIELHSNSDECLFFVKKNSKC